MSTNTSGSCGCYEKTKKRTPANLSNSPGLSSLKYRVGTHSQFKADMLELISRKPALKNLTTQENNDLSIALLDSWATIADVLSFYQERIANEGYLRTATERRSVLELARALGYELKPGVVASVPLVFTVETAAGAPLQTRVDEGTTVMSVPGQDEKLQIFETIETIEAKAALNDLRPLQFAPQEITLGMTDLYLKGVNTNLVPGDALLIVNPQLDEDANDEIVSNADVNDVRWVFRFIQTVTTYPDKNYTHITLEKSLRYGTEKGYQIRTEEPMAVFAFRQRASFFGYNAPDWKAMPYTLKLAYNSNLCHSNQYGLEEGVADDDSQDWPAFEEIFSPVEPTSDSSNIKIHLDAVYTKILPQSWVIFAGQRKPDEGLVDYFSVALCKVTNVEVSAQTDFALSAKTTKLVLDVNAASLSGFRRRATVVFCVSEPLEITDEPAVDPMSKSYIVLDRKVPELVKGQKIIVQGKLAKTTIKEKYIDSLSNDDSRESSADSLVADVWWIKSSVNVSGDNVFYRFFNKAGQSVLLAVNPNPLNIQTPNALSDSDIKFKSPDSKSKNIKKIGDNVGKLLIHDSFDRVLRTSQGWKLLTPRPIVEASGFLRWYVTLESDNGAKAYEGYIVDEIGQETISSGGQDALVVSEVVSIKELYDEAGTTKIILETPAGQPYALTNDYDLASLHIYANVAFATHGETVHETLGSGNSFDIHQQFRLRKPPLTYLSAATPGGAKSTLKVYVNDVQWPEVPAICYLNSTDLGYSVRIEDNGDTSVSFGDGITGARLPSGIENITANYRSGIGLQGAVGANKLTLMAKKPFGIRSVTNPLAASGAASPEKMEDAKINAPSAVLTLGRIVSLKDYENFARTFLGIAKARATAELNTSGYIVRLIVAPVDAKPLALTSLLYINLKEAIAGVCAYGQKVYLKSFTPVYFNVTGVLYVDSSYQSEDVYANVKIALIKTFSFEQRTFRQAVSLEEVVSVILIIPGVIYVDQVGLSLRDLVALSILDLKLTDDMLLMINPEGITLGVET
jgi:hypothetical protein